MPAPKRPRQVWLFAILLLVAGLVTGNPVARALSPAPDQPGAAVARPGGDAAVAPTAAEDPENVAAIRRLGGEVDYGTVAPTGERSGITARITPAMVEAAGDGEVGSPPDPDIRPPGFEDLPARNRSRGHLLGRQLAGSGKVDANLVALFQNRANSPVMSGYEGMVADAARAGQTIQYAVTPEYDDGGLPERVRLKATGDRGFRFEVVIENSRRAPVEEIIPPPAT
jgi:DNA/RNA non-specific endonuclease